ncbi:MAG: CDGSH iron-sulfur domain-containing protein [Gammaproteobacteria bacterium]|nr:CDGSH iron-sulfur domain-containing protein [Gammaproteobacteria bacterium]
MGKEKTTTYQGKNIDVQWDRRLCIHIGECGYSAGDLFVGGRDPWCRPDLADDEEVRDVIRRCPSGALTYNDKVQDEHEQPAACNTVQVVYNGPLYIQGDLHIENAPDDMPGVRYRAALCRCGQSANKPFCDNSHLKAGFEDYAAVGEQGDGIDEEGGKMTIKSVANGPLLLSGNFAIIAGSGRVAWRGKQAALCRCGHSKNKPFCDGSHNDAGFEAE